MTKTEILTRPKHVAIIVDGNGRWAKRRLLPHLAGYRAGLTAGYGGRWDIVQALRHFAAQAAQGRVLPNEIDESSVSQCLALAELPDPELFIRTGGEQRISNFLLRNLAYTELCLTESLWPDFDAQAHDEALRWHSSRQRRFRSTSEQTQGDPGA